MTIAEIPGVTVANDTTGQPNEITIDLRQHPEAIPVLKELGLLPKSQFDIDFDNGMTPEEFRDSLLNVIKEHDESRRSETGA